MKVIKQSAHIVKDWPKMNLYERCEFAGRISHASEDKIKEGSAEEFVRRMVKLGHESVFEFARIKFHWSDVDEISNLRSIRETIKIAEKEKCAGYNINLSHWTMGIFVGRECPAFFEDVRMERFLNEVNYKSKLEPNFSWEPANDWIPVFITTNRAISHQLVRYRKDVVYLQQSQRYVKYKDCIEVIDPSVYFEQGSKSWDFWEYAMKQADDEYFNLIELLGHSAQAARLVLPNSAATKLIMYASPDTWRHVFDQRISDKADPMIRELLEPLKEEFVKEGLL